MGYANGNVQNINGVEYTMYSPAWYAATQAEAQRSSAAQGTAAGAKLAAASTASGLPLVPSTGGTASSTNISAGAAGAAANPATVPSPAVTGLTAAIGGGVQMPTAPTTAVGSGGAGGTSTPAHLAPVDTSAAEAASFNRAKDQVGQESAGALTGLRSALGGRGMLGSGLEERGTAAAATSAAGELGDVSRQQAVTRADEAQKNATTNFQGDVTQRGQDFQKEEAGNSLAGNLAMAGYSGQITQRGQDITNANAQKALEIEQAQLGAQQRSTALAGLEAALKTTSPALY